MNEELRCYTFTNFILRPIQQGIQAGHAAMELVNKYMLEEGWQDGYAEQVAEWVKNHKTMICLNGGMNAGIEDIYAFLHDDQNPFPYTPFYEDQQTAAGMLTSVAMILPARIFNGAAMLGRVRFDPQVTVTEDHLREEVRISWVDEIEDEARDEVYSLWEYELMQRLNKLRLAT